MFITSLLSNHIHPCTVTIIYVILKSRCSIGYQIHQIERKMQKVLFDQKKHYKAKQYEYIKIQDKDGEGNVLDSFSHLIRPIGSETETVDIDPVQIIRDFITLIGEYTRCTHLQRMINDGPYSYKGIKDKARQNWIANENKYFYREEKQMLNALLTFINKYGLFGLMDDRVMKYDPSSFKRL